MDQDWLNAIAGWGAAAIGLTGAGLAVRRKMSQDSTQRAKDRAESEFVSQLLRERDAGREEARTAREELRVATQQAHRDAETIARLTSQAEYLQTAIYRQEEEMESFKRRLGRLYPETRDFVQSIAAELSPPASKGRP